MRTKDDRHRARIVGLLLLLALLAPVFVCCEDEHEGEDAEHHHHGMLVADRPALRAPSATPLADLVSVDPVAAAPADMTAPGRLSVGGPVPPAPPPASPTPLRI